MKTLVIYNSKTGFAKKYAKWIGQELSGDIFEFSKVTTNLFEAYDTIIYGGSLYAVGINGIKLIIHNLDKLKGKKVIVYATGASPCREEIICEVKNNNLTLEQQKNIEFFYLRGGFDFSKLKPVDKVLMILLKWKLKMKKDLLPDEKGMLAAYDAPQDFTKKSNIEDLISYVNSIC